MLEVQRNPAGDIEYSLVPIGLLETEAFVGASFSIFSRCLVYSARGADPEEAYGNRMRGS